MVAFPGAGQGEQLPISNTRIRALARTVDRHPPEVLDNLTDLEQYGLVDLQTDGRAKRPVVWYDHLDVDSPLTPDLSDTDVAAP